MASALALTIAQTTFAQPSVSYLDDTAVIMEYDSVFDVHTDPDPAKYPDQRSQPGNFTTNRVLEDLEPYVHSDGYDFVLLYTVREVPGWIHAGSRYSTPNGKNIGHLNSDSGNSWKPGNSTGWDKLRSAPHMNSVDFIDRPEPNRPNYGGSRTVFHESFHYWGPDITGNYTVGPREWKPGDPLAWLAQTALHWSWNFADPTMPGIMASGATSSQFNAFDLYLMGLVDYAEASTFSYTIYELDPVTQGVPNDPGLFHELTIDDLIVSLALRGPDYFEGDGRRIPEIDETAEEFHALVVVVKGKDDVLTESHTELIRDMVADIPPAWEIATWGRSMMDARVELPVPAAPSFIQHPFDRTVAAGELATLDRRSQLERPY
jgi:hypothetical protein